MTTNQVEAIIENLVDELNLSNIIVDYKNDIEETEKQDKLMKKFMKKYSPILPKYLNKDKIMEELIKISKMKKIEIEDFEFLTCANYLSEKTGDETWLYRSDLDLSIIRDFCKIFNLDKKEVHGNEEDEDDEEEDDENESDLDEISEENIE